MKPFINYHVIKINFYTKVQTLTFYFNDINYNLQVSENEI